jgi:hypothetical protein
MTTEYIEDQTGQNLVQIAFPISKPLTIFPKNFLETKRLCRRLVSERMVVLYGGVFLAPPPLHTTDNTTSFLNTIKVTLLAIQLFYLTNAK